MAAETRQFDGVVRTPEEARVFLGWCLTLLGRGFHPDDSFREYENRDGTLVFTNEDADRYDALMEQVVTLVGDPSAEILRLYPPQG